MLNDKLQNKTIQEGKEILNNEKDSNSNNSNCNSSTPKTNSKTKTTSSRRGRNYSNRGNQGKGLKNYFNHPEWYMPNDAIGEQIASIPFNVPAGGKLNISGFSMKNSFDHTNIGASSAISRLQSVMAVDYISTPGVSTTGISGINMAAAKIYAAIRSKNSGAKVYEAADVMMYILLMQDIYANLCSILRILGICSHFETMDRNVPETFGSAMRVDLDDVRANRANYFSKINTIIDKINSFAVPANLKIFKRSAYITSSIFKDSENKLGQYYLFNKLNYYRWSAKTSTKGTELVFHTYNSNPADKLSTYIAIIDQQLSDLFLDSDVLTISSDILKAFDSVSLYKFKSIDIDFRTEPHYDSYILDQIHNMKWVNIDITDLVATDFNIKQENQLIKYQPRFNEGATSVETTWPVYFSSTIIDSHSDLPKYTDVLESTRLMFTAESSSKEPYVYVTSCGSELPLNVSLHYRSANGASHFDPAIPMVVFRFTGENAATFGDSLASEFTALNKLSQFRMAPLRFQVVSASDTAGQWAQWAGFDIIGDTHLTTNIESATIKNINDIVMYAMFILE